MPESSHTLTLAIVNPILAAQWHPTKNAPLTPSDVTYGSPRKVWWICAKGHEWQAAIATRNIGSGCPYCSGHYASPEYCLQVDNPHLAAQWHLTKNAPLTPFDVTPHTGRKVWWLCTEGTGHEWEATVASRNKGRGCPFCAGFKVSEEDSLSVRSPAIAAQWHPTLNGSLTPHDVPANTKRSVWWICEKGHEWRRHILTMIRDSRCPVCLGQGLSLAEADPVLAAQWHPVRNGTLTSSDVTQRTDKKAWWICQQGHEYEMRIASRRYGGGCPYCKGRVPLHENVLRDRNPALAAQWHPTKNLPLTPADVTCGMGRRVWWMCKNGHEWQALIHSRHHGTGCPICSNRVVTFDNCLQTRNPSLAAQWHPTRNAPLTPSDVVCGSTRKVWWVCVNGHEWQATVNNRHSGKGCPHCVRDRKSPAT